jgi:hypothetical protein
MCGHYVYSPEAQRNLATPLLVSSYLRSSLICSTMSPFSITAPSLLHLLAAGCVTQGGPGLCPTGAATYNLRQSAFWIRVYDHRTPEGWQFGFSGVILSLYNITLSVTAGYVLFALTPILYGSTVTHTHTHTHTHTQIYLKTFYL